MNPVILIANSEARPLIDSLIAQQKPSSEIANAAMEQYGSQHTPNEIEAYRQGIMLAEDGPLRQIAKVTQDLGGLELPPQDELSKLSANFSFQKTNEDLEMIYDRIRKLKKLADDNPEEASYDRRLCEHIAKAEAIRTRVFRHQYEQIRQAILLTVGKKICTAAISILLPYIPRDLRKDAMRRFQAAIEPILSVKVIPDPPADIETAPL